MSDFQGKIEKLMKEHPDLFPTEAAFWTYLRGALRRSLWSKSPMKHKFKSSQTTPPPEEYTGRGRKGAVCALTGEWEMTSKLEVDHKIGNKSLRSEEDVLPFILHLLASGDELQLVTKEAHKVKSLAERRGITFEEALTESEVNKKMRETKVAQDKELKSLGLPFGNDAKRRDSWKQVLGKPEETK